MIHLQSAAVSHIPAAEADHFPFSVAVTASRQATSSVVLATVLSSGRSFVRVVRHMLRRYWPPTS